MMVAHAGAGASWQAAVVVIAIVLAATFVLGMFHLIALEGPGDLAIPVAVALAGGALGVLGETWLSDGIGWALPLAIVATLGLLGAVFSPLALAPFAPLAMGVLALALIVPTLLYQPLTLTLHPPADVLPLADDSQIDIVSPATGSRVGAGEVIVTVRVEGGSIGPGDSPLDVLGGDPEEAGGLLVTVDGTPVSVAWIGCSVAEPCGEVSFPVRLAPGTRTVSVEFTRGDGMPLAPYVADQVEVIAEAAG